MPRDRHRWFDLPLEMLHSFRGIEEGGSPIFATKIPFFVRRVLR